MPPANFAQSAVSGVNPLHVPKATQARLKDAILRVRAVLLKGQPNTVDPVERAAADRAIGVLLDDANVSPPPYSVQSKDSAWQLSRQIAQKFNADLADIFLTEMDQGDRAKVAELIAFLSQLGEFLGSAAIMMEWWDLVLHPVLKDPTAPDKTAACARALVVMAASAVPVDAYIDELEPIPLWPPVNEKHSVRKTEDAPYHKTSTELVGKASRKVSSTSEPLQALGRASLRSVGPTDMHRKFVQRLFDLFVQEASSPLGRDENDDEKLDSLHQLQSTASLTTDASTSNLAKTDRTSASDDGRSYLWHTLQLEQLQPIDLAGTTWKGNLEAILITFGQNRPKEFFHHLSASFDEPIHRIPILMLLTVFCRLNSFHSFHITSTKLMQYITTSLQLDTSTTLISLSITALIILIPQIPNWIANGGAGGVPVLLVIYARVIDWRRLDPGWEHRLGEGEEKESLRSQLDKEFTELGRLSKRLSIRPGLQWRRLESSIDTELTAKPDVMRFFTIVYGLFPCNIIRFLRAPIDYLRDAQCSSLLDADWEDVIDESGLQSRSEPILRSHVLHPAIVEMTAEREITDKQRWLQHDAADTTAECISLSVESWDSTAVDAQQLTPHDDLIGADYRQSCSDQRQAQARIVDPRGPRSLNSSSLRETCRVSSQQGADDVLTSYTELRWGGTTLRRNSIVNAASTAQMQRLPSRSSTGTRQMQRAATFNNAAYRSISESPASSARSTVPPQNRLSSPAEPALYTQLHEATQRTQQSAPASLTQATGRVPPRDRSLSSWTYHLTNLPMRMRQSQHLSRLPSASLGSPAETQAGAARGAITADLALSSPSRMSIDHQSQRAAKLEVYSELKYLQRENLLLRNELNFELYLKDQHLRHIGHLHRDRIKDSRIEAERQNLYQTVKLLHSQLTSLSNVQERQRVEAATSKARHTQWENELNAKLKGYRENRKIWTAESRELRARIESDRATIDAQAKRLQEANTELSELRTEMQRIGPHAAKVKEYEAKNALLTRCLVHWDEDVRKYEKQRREMETLLSRWRGMEMLFNGSEEDRWRMSVEVEDQQEEIKRLRRELQAVKNGSAAGCDAKSDGKATDLLPSFEQGGCTLASRPNRAGLQSESQAHVLLRRRVESLQAELLAYRSKEEAVMITKQCNNGGENVMQEPKVPLEGQAAPPIELRDVYEINRLELEEMMLSLKSTEIQGDHAADSETSRSRDASPSTANKSVLSARSGVEGEPKSMQSGHEASDQGSGDNEKWDG